MSWKKNFQVCLDEIWTHQIVENMEFPRLFSVEVGHTGFQENGISAMVGGKWGMWGFWKKELPLLLWWKRGTQDVIREWISKSVREKTGHASMAEKVNFQVCFDGNWGNRSSENIQSSCLFWWKWGLPDFRACPLMTADIDGLRYSPDDPYYGLGPVHTSLYVRVAWDWWLGHLPRSHGTGEGGDWWSWPMGVKAKGMLSVCQGESSNSRIP